nr:PREDICTED: myb-like protein W [Megachile rotundata]XP_012150294.1 PREDICTED: myb-like protein W [Megachile rotundata]XP_012150295.1 PREDICTED: myb-like protein W [Megachile rotundata]
MSHKMAKTKTGSKVTSTRSIMQTRNASSKKKTIVSVSQDKETAEKQNQKNKECKQRSKETTNNNRIIAAKTVTFNNSSNLDRNKTEDIKRQNSRNEISENISNKRQMSLKESFMNQSKMRVLRSFKNAKVHKNDLTSTKGDNPFNLKDCSIILENKLNVSNKRLPVYKCVLLESSKENSNEIYEFKFDANDSAEKVPKKRKKKLILKKAFLSKKKKNIRVNNNVQKTKIDKKAPDKFQVKEVNELEEKKEEKNNKKVTEKDSAESKENKVSVEPVTEPVSKDNLHTETDIHKTEGNINEEEVENNNITKPTVVSVEELNNKKITIMNNSQISNSNDFRPFRPTNVFKNEFAVPQKNMFNRSLFGKSLSPIKKLSEDSDIASPWRLPPLFAFSQVNNVFQSTPQNRKFDIASNRFVRTLNNETKSYVDTINTKILKRNNENISAEGHVNTINLKKKTPLVSRKFGTEITNMNQSLQSNLGESINELVTSDVENIQPSTIQSPSMINFSINNTFSSGTNESNENNENHENHENRENKENKENKENRKSKENNTTNYLSKKVFKKKKIKSQSPKKSALRVQMDEQKENMDPQPGPSGLQNRLSSNNLRVLRQSNLNNFLNIAEMPQSTVIKTPHRIFDDVCSTPISSKSDRKMNKSVTDLKNAFGFDEEDSNQDVLLIECKNTNDKEKQDNAIQTNLENNNRPLARLSIGEIKYKLLSNKLKDDVRKEQNVETKKLIAKKSPIKENKKTKIDIINFSDTFDVFSEMDESVSENIPEVPLFADCEPTHFKQPPRYSYKRKRAVKFNLSDETDHEEEEDLEFEPESKRKKGNKMKAEQENRLMEWVDSINKSFNEVDEYELVIE